MKNISCQGQALLEAVIAIGLITMVLTGLLSAITVSLANAQFSKSKAQATKYADQAIEWARSERDSIDWATFSNYATGNITYCLNTLAWQINGSCPVINDDVDIFTRTVRLVPTGSDKVAVTVYVSWTQASRPHTVQLDTILTKW